jgi:hypothetical protein
MAHAPKPNTSSHQPVWRWKGPQFRGAPPRKESVVEDGRLAFSFRRMPGYRDWWRPLWVEVLAKREGGGYEVEIRCRGWRYIFPGTVSLQDALRTINGHPGLDELMVGYRHPGEPVGGGSGPLGASS